MFIGLLSCGGSLSRVAEVFKCNVFTREVFDWIKCLSLNNEPCQLRSTLIEVNSNERFYYPFAVSVNRCGESCNTLNDRYAPICFPDKEKNVNGQLLKLMLRVTETRSFYQHDLYKCKCRLNQNLCNTKQKWNHDNCRCECKESTYSNFCEKGYMWNFSTCQCTCQFPLSSVMTA